MSQGNARFEIRIPLPGSQAEYEDERRRAARLFGQPYQETTMSETTRTDHAENIKACIDAGFDLLDEIEKACGISTTMHPTFEQIESEANLLAAERDALIEYARMVEYHYMNALDDVPLDRRQRHPKVGHLRRDNNMAAIMETHRS